MDKENQTRRSYSAAALLRKQAAAAAAAASNIVPLPRVAALTANSGRSSRQDGKAAQPRTRPLSSLAGSVPNPNTRPPSASAHRVGCKPATHSTRTLVPLLDAAAPGCAPVAAASAASRVPPMPAASSVPAARSAVSVEIGDAGLDSAEAALQQELAQADQRLELLQQQQSRRRSATPDLGPSPTSTALSARAHALPLQHGATPPVVQPANQHPQPVQLGPVAAEPQQQQQHQELEQQQQGQQPQQQQLDDLVPSPSPSQRPETPYVPPSDQSIVRSIVTATGTGCKDVIAAHAAATLAAGACWTTRGHRVLHQESSCILQLCGRSTSDITLRITFADAASVPCLVRLEHAPSPTATFERLGDIQLQAKSLKQLRHLFRLGKSLDVQRFMRISLIGHMAQDHSGAHRVSHMLLTSGQGPQRTPSPSPAPDSPPVAGVSTAASAQASVELGNPPDTPTADSATSEEASAAAPMDDVPAPTAATETAAVPLQPGNCSAVASAAAADQPAPAMPAKALSSAASSTSGSSGSSIQSAGQQPRERLAVVPASNMPAPPQSAVPQSEAPQPAAPVPRVSQPVATKPPANPTKSQPNNHQENHDVRASLGVGKKADEDLVSLASQAGAGAAEASQGQQPVENRLQCAEQQERQVQPPKDLQLATASTAPPPVMLLPMQRCSDVMAVLSRFGLSPSQAKELLLDLLGPAEKSCAGAKLTEEQVEELVGCLPSADERRLLARFGGRAEQLGTAEQFMLAVMQVPAARERMEARCFASQAASRAKAAAAMAAVLGCACVEVAQSNLLRMLLKVALAAGNFLNAGNQNGTAAGFQIDALLKLKDVRSSRARTPTLLHLVAREVSRQHPEGISLLAALPSAAAASRIDLPAVKTDVLELTAAARQVEQALAAALEGAALSSSACAAAAAHLATFRAEVVERVGTVLADLDDADAAFRHLGSFINGQRATLADPAAFFGVLHAFAEELEVAHEENAAADATASAGNATAKAAPGRSKDGKPRRQSKATSSSNSAAASSGTARQRASTASSTHEYASSAGQHQPADQEVQAADKEALLERLKQASVEGLQSVAAGAGSQRKQHSPQPCMSKAAIAGIGGLRRSAARAAESGAGGSPGVGVRSAGAQSANGSQAGDTAAADADAAKLSTPVATLLAESARIISSIDCGQGGFGSAIGSSAAASGTAAAPAAAEQDTAGTPDGAVRPAAVAEEEEEGAEAETGFATPRGMLAVRWPGQHEQMQQGAGEHKRQGPDPAADQHQVPANGEALHAASLSAAGAPAAGAVPAERPAPSHAGSLASRGTQGTGLSQLRQRSLQQLSPTSTPLSSLGRQSSHCSSSYSSDCGSTPPRPSMRMQGPQLQRSASPLGLGTAVAEAEGRAGAAAGTSATQAPAAAAQAPALAGKPLSSAEQGSTMDVPAEQDLLDLLPAQGPPAQQPSDSSLHAAAAAQTAAGSGVGQPAPQVPAQQPCGHSGLEAGWVEEEEEEVLPPMGGFHALHSRASSCDLTYYAPFSMEREPEAFADPKQKARQGLAASFSYGQGGPASALGPLGAHQLRASGLLRHTSADEAVLAGAAAAAAKAGNSRHASLSMPSSPSRGANLLAAGRRPPPLNLHGLADRLQVHAQPQAAPPAGVQGSASQQQHRRQPSSGLEELLSGVPALLPPPQPELAADDLADLAGLSSDHEVEWQALEQIEKQNAEWQQQQAVEQEMREMLLLQLPVQAEQAQPSEWMPVQQEPAAAPDLQQQEMPGAGGQEGGEAAQLAAELAALPSPINANTSDLDAAVARLLASAGHTPTGPLGLGMRGVPADRGMGQAAVAEKSSEPARASAASTLPGGGRQVALLEPVMPAPLGEGIRASTTLGEQVPAAALLKSLECSRATLRRSLSIAAGQQPAGSTTTLSLEAAEWEAAVAAAEAARDGAEGGPAALGDVTFSAPGSTAMEWGVGGGPVRRRGLRRFLTARRRHY